MQSPKVISKLSFEISSLLAHSQDFSDIFTANSSFDNFCAKIEVEVITNTNRINFFIFNSILYFVVWFLFFLNLNYSKIA